MPATNCLTASMLEIGMKHQAKLSFSHEQVERYCELSGDMNAIHRNVAAAQLRFPDVKDIVVPGGLVQITVTGLFGTLFPGGGSLGLTFTPERFRKPVCPGSYRIDSFRIRKNSQKSGISVWTRASTSSCAPATSRTCAAMGSTK